VRKPEGVSGGAQASSCEGRDRNSERISAGGSNEGECTKGDTANENVIQPQEQRPKDTFNRRPKDNKDMERARVNVSSREFVRGGRGHGRGSTRGRGRGGHQDVYGSASQRKVESVNRESAVDANNTRVASAGSNATRTNGSEQKRPGDGRTDAQQSKTEDRRSSHEVGSQQTPKVSAEDRQNDSGTVQSPSDDRRSKAQGNIPTKDAGRLGEIPAQTNRRRTEFYDSRNRGQRMRQSDARANNASKPQPHTAPAKDGIDAEKNATASSRDSADTPNNKYANDAASEQTSQRKPGENFV